MTSILCFCSATTFAYLAWCDAKQPTWQLIAEPASIDFGRVARGSDRVAEVHISNSGTEAVEIMSIETSCSCSMAEISEKRVEPMRDVVLKLRVSFGQGSGTVASRVTILYRNPAASQLRRLAVEAVGSVASDLPET